MEKKRYVGLGIGASRVKLVHADAELRSPQVLVREHLGNPRAVVEDMLSEIDPGTVAGFAVTGGDGAAMINGRKICECEAVEETLRLLGIRVDAVLSLGGESFVAYPLDKRGRVLDYVSGNRCAAGTVEFYKQQLGRMNLTIEEAARIAAEGSVVPLAKRCSVHCKSDCTHALNKNRCGVADIAHTLCHNMAEKAVGLLRNHGFSSGRLLVIGGASSNRVIVDYIGKLLPDCKVIVPAEAEYFEALGAASLARRRSLSLPLDCGWSQAFRKTGSSFDFLPPLRDFADMVTFLPGRRAKVRAGRQYLLGIDGGSTTTKAALVDTESLEICASLYVRTNGNPEAAMKECLLSIKRQIETETAEDSIAIVGVATTGSSGEILSVLCETPAYHNEIIAHAYGASHFCPDVDTIFEIGGQDSKFTSLRSRVAIDFNMNESCSAGTGSFIEECAKDDLAVPMHSIAAFALKSDKPPRFSDQCAAFANTDIRKAFQEGSTKEDNLAGLVYAIVENYISKVVGKRKIGDKILFQGGTSKNEAIAYAFAAKTGKHITVPPDSELIGCFGIALWLKEKIAAGEIEKRRVVLDAMLGSSVAEKKEFVCKTCENFCSIQNLTIGGRKYPFGGQCSKWENARQNKTVDIDELDLVAKRNRMLFEEFGAAPSARHNEGKPVIGLQGIFSVYTLYPLYSRFFAHLGYSIALSETVDPRGVQMCQSARCYPYEIAHGTFYDLMRRGVKEVFVPHLVSLPRNENVIGSLACPIAQGVPYYLAAAFESDRVKIRDPIVDLTNGLRAAEETFVQLGVTMGHSAEEARRAFLVGCEMQESYELAVKEEGGKALKRIEREDRVAVVVVGRPYNAFSKVANMGIPRKFASRGVVVIPFEFVPHDREEPDRSMYWAYGQMILRSLKYVRRNRRLFPVYISNFGCGPDSFLQHFAGFIMGKKPMLYLELDSHTADAGIGTRVAAFLDIAAGYLRLNEGDDPARPFRSAELVTIGSRNRVRMSSGDMVPAKDRRVTLVFPSMGRLNSEAAAAAARAVGYKAVAMPPVDDRVRAIGKSFTSGKECSPAVFTVGSLIDYYQRHHKKHNKDDVTLFFMPTASGPCRFGQYNVYMKNLINMLGMEDVAIFSPSADNGYGGLGWRFLRAGWQCLIISDVMRDIRSSLALAAKDTTEASRVFEREWQRICKAIARGYGATWRALERASRNLARIPLKTDPQEIPKVLLAGEIYVRSDELSRRGIEEYYAHENLMLKIADSSEWVYYTDWHYLNGLCNGNGFPSKILGKRTFWKHVYGAFFRGDKNSRAFVIGRLKLAFEQRVDRKVRRIMGKCGLLCVEQHDIEHVIHAGSSFVNPALAGEAILTAGAAKLAFDHAAPDGFCGAVFIGPFNCMPTGVAESVIKPYMRRNSIPYLTFETDGGPMTPNFRSQMEVHVLRSKIYSQERKPELMQ